MVGGVPNTTYDIGIAKNNGDMCQPAGSLTTNKNGIGNGSWFHYDNPDITKAIDAENAEVDLMKRQQMVKDVQKMIMADAAPLMPFITGSAYISWNKRVGGLDPTLRNFQYQRYTEFIKPGV